MEPEQRGRASRASSTSSLGREVRCGCQYYQSDSLLPERRAMLHGRPSSRTTMQPRGARCSEHEYEPIAPPSPQPATAPVVRITDTDVMPVADSDVSIDDRGLPPELVPDGDVILPLDGKIEDTAMEGRELVETGDTSEEQETAQQLQDRLEERFLSAPTPGTESRTDGEVNTSQVDSTALEELPLQRGARGLPQRIKTQAGKLRSRLRGFQRQAFSIPGRAKTAKAKSTSSGRSDKSRSPRAEKRPSRMERLRTSISERKFSLPDRPKFSLPDKSKFHLPEKFTLPERPKFNIKKPNIKLPSALTRSKKPPPLREQQQQRSTDSTVGSKRNIFDFSTYPRIFDKKSKRHKEYATSSPKDSRAQSAESATFPRARKGLPIGARWAQPRYSDAEFEAHSDATDEKPHPWRHPSLEEPRISRLEEEALASQIPWEETRKRRREEEEIQYMDYEQESPEISERQAHPRSETPRTEDESYEREQEIDPRLYDNRNVRNIYSRVPKEDEVEEGNREEWRDEEIVMAEQQFRPIQRSRSLGEEVLRDPDEERYHGSFPPVDPRRFEPRKLPSEEDEEMESDREQQQSSGSSCDRRRRGVIEEIDSDEFFLRESGISQDDMNLGKYLTSEIRDALRADVDNALADDDVPIPPQRPMRSRSLRKRKEETPERYEIVPPVRPKRERARSRRKEESADDVSRERSRSGSRHRVVYQAEGTPQEQAQEEPLDDIVIVKPVRRKSKSSSRSQSQPPIESIVSSTPAQIIPRPPSPPPVAPARRKRLHRETIVDQRNGDIMCNGHHEWIEDDYALEKPLPTPENIEEHRATEVEMIVSTSQEDLKELEMRLEEDQVEPVPVPPKRRSRSRGASAARDEDRTSHGAESLPEAGYVEEDIPHDEIEAVQDQSGYAIIEKREKPPRPPPPRRRRRKFATTPRPTPPKRPQRAYSTLGPARSKVTSSIMSETVSTTFDVETAPYIEIDSDDGEHKDLRSGEILSKMQGRPLPAPPRPPRARKEQILERTTHPMQEITMEVTTSTQTDPLPDDMVIEEEVTQARLVVTPSRSGSQVLVSTERIPSPSRMSTPPVPPLPASQFLHRDSELHTGYDSTSLKSTSPLPDQETLERRAAEIEEKTIPDEELHRRLLRSALLSEEPLRIGSLEVGDLRVDRLSVSQIEAQKLVASEVDAIVITASEMRSSVEENLSPSIIRELIAIRSHLESVAASQTQTQYSPESTKEIGTQKTDIPSTDDPNFQDQKEPEPPAPEPVPDQPALTDEEKPKEDQKVVRTEVTEATNKEMLTTQTLSVTPVQVEEKKVPLDTLTVAQTEVEDIQPPVTHSLTVDIERQVSDSDPSLALSSRADPSEEDKLDESRHTLPASETISAQSLATGMQSETTSEGLSEDSSETQRMSPSSDQPAGKESETGERKPRKSRSRSPSPIGYSARQTASPVRSLPPAISVTPDTPDTAPSCNITSEAQPQRAVISYSADTEYSQRESQDSQRESSASPLSSVPVGGTHFVAFPVSQIPPEFFSMRDPDSQRQLADSEPSVVETTQQLLRALRIAGKKAMGHFVTYLTTTVSRDESADKIRELELAICALLLLIAGLLILYFNSSRTITHYHHWDYFNPPQP